MSSQHTTPNGPTTHHPNAKTPQPKETLPPGSISGKYRNENLPKPIHLYDAMYVLSREGNIWPHCEQDNGALGVYTSLENAKRAGDRWLRKPPGLHLDGFDSSEIRISEWKVSDKTRDWVKQKGEIGKGFLESRVVRIKKCKVRTDSSLPQEPEDDGGKDEEKKDQEQKDHEDDEQDDVKEKGDNSAVEGMKRLAV
ncbi:MAG: hypothetical protein ALECFALPRED_002212 [Alectoria fallacina]|uniref:Uncharacterized protein n=1 Tax=Alectoria fallacina TaxID=1903189 RepID=A0A8H3EH13_9LECA|nr:MAG: hypothetical protein ALECFALPRED_002212 [Alectoria fallacina]